MTAIEDPGDRWFSEALAIDLDPRDFAVADAAELPTELMHFAAAAEADPEFGATFSEWLEWLLDEKHDAFGCYALLLGIEQRAWDGVILPWSMRGVRLSEASEEEIDALHFFWTHCPKHVAAHLTNYVYWLVRSERARRLGTPDWSPARARPAGAIGCPGEPPQM